MGQNLLMCPYKIQLNFYYNILDYRSSQGFTVDVDYRFLGLCAVWIWAVFPAIRRFMLPVSTGSSTLQNFLSYIPSISSESEMM
jgi:hypothetical protein